MNERGEKRGLSAVVGTLLIILLTIVLIIILWTVLKGVIRNQSEQVFLGKLTLDLKISQVEKNETHLNITVKRGTGEGNMSGIAFMVYDKDNSEVIRINYSMQELEQRNFQIELYVIDTSKVERVSVAPIFKLESGKEITGDVKDEYHLTWGSAPSGGTSGTGGSGGGSNGGGGGSGGGASECTSNTECNDNNDCTENICSNGVCQYITINLCGAECTSDLGCQDGDDCTENICSNGVCQEIAINGCVPTECLFDFDCEDNNPCTRDICPFGTCRNLPLYCSDNNECTEDSCSNGDCQHTVIPGCNPTLLCNLLFADWNTTTVLTGDPIKISVTGIYCSDRILTFQIFEKDYGNNPDDFISKRIMNTTFDEEYLCGLCIDNTNYYWCSSENTCKQYSYRRGPVCEGNDYVDASYGVCPTEKPITDKYSFIWPVQWRDDTEGNETNPPEYYFTVNVTNSSESITSSLLTITRRDSCGDILPPGPIGFSCGDGKCNGEENITTCFSDCAPVINYCEAGYINFSNPALFQCTPGQPGCFECFTGNGCSNGQDCVRGRCGTCNIETSGQACSDDSYNFNIGTCAYGYEGLLGVHSNNPGWGCYNNYNTNYFDILCDPEKNLSTVYCDWDKQGYPCKQTGGDYKADGICVLLPLRERSFYYDDLICTGGEVAIVNRVNPESIEVGGGYTQGVLPTSYYRGCANPYVPNESLCDTNVNEPIVGFRPNGRCRNGICVPDASINCIPTSVNEIGLCSDNIDNDCDGKTDFPNDGDCCGFTEICDDCIDNDCDGLIDCSDDICSFSATCSPAPSPPVPCITSTQCEPGDCVRGYCDYCDQSTSGFACSSQREDNWSLGTCNWRSDDYWICTKWTEAVYNPIQKIVEMRCDGSTAGWACSNHAPGEFKAVGICTMSSFAYSCDVNEAAAKNNGAFYASCAHIFVNNGTPCDTNVSSPTIGFYPDGNCQNGVCVRL